MILTTEQIMARWTLEHLDFCSLYPFVQWMFSFTTNPHPKSIVERRELDHIMAKLPEFLDTQYGQCYCKVLPPKRLIFAVLPYKTRNKSIYCLCRTCGEDANCEVSHLISYNISIVHFSGMRTRWRRTSPHGRVFILRTSQSHTKRLHSDSLVRSKFALVVVNGLVT